MTLFGLAGSHVPGVTIRELEVRPATFSARAREDVSTQPGAFLAAHHAYLEALTELASDCPFDVVHANTLHYLPVAMAASLPVEPVLSLHCPPTPWLESALQVAGQLGALPLAVTAVSRALAREWRHVVRSPAVIPNGIDLAAWQAGPGGSGSGCAWVGRIVPEKAPHLAIDAARAAGRHVRLAGPIIDRGYWEAEVRPRLGRHATYEGHLDHRGLVALVGAAAVSIQSPVWEEPFGLTAAEAMACGTPVAAFARGGLRDVIGAASGCLARPGDVASLAAAITRAAQLDRAGVRADAAARLGVDAMGLGYEAAYLRQVQRAGPPAASEATPVQIRVPAGRAVAGLDAGVSEGTPAAA